MVSTVPVMIPLMVRRSAFNCDHSVFFAEESGVAPSHRFLMRNLSHCEVVEMRNSADAVGDLCSRT